MSATPLLAHVGCLPHVRGFPIGRWSLSPTPRCDAYIGISISVPSDRRAYIKADGSDSDEVSNVLVMSICEKESVW